MLQAFFLKIRRRETPFYDFLYRTAKRVRAFRIPAWKPVFLPLYYFHRFILSSWASLTRVLYFEPLFRARCNSVGKRLQLFGGLPYIAGALNITIGDDCELYGRSTFASTRVYDQPELIVGNDTHLGYMTTISVGQRVEIGNHVLVAQRCFIADNDGHPIDYRRRRKESHEPVSKEQIQPVKIEDDCWIGSDTIILKGVTIGQGSIIGTNSVVSRSIPPFCIAAGSPARVIKQLPIPEEFSHLEHRRSAEIRES